jgi:hypothetical protein
MTTSTAHDREPHPHMAPQMDAKRRSSPPARATTRSWVGSSIRRFTIELHDREVAGAIGLRGRFTAWPAATHGIEQVMFTIFWRAATTMTVCEAHGLFAALAVNV